MITHIDVLIYIQVLVHGRVQIVYEGDTLEY